MEASASQFKQEKQLNRLKEKNWLRWRRRWDPGEKTGNKQNRKKKLEEEMEAIHKTIERA